MNITRNNIHIITKQALSGARWKGAYQKALQQVISTQFDYKAKLLRSHEARDKMLKILALSTRHNSDLGHQEYEYARMISNENDAFAILSKYPDVNRYHRFTSMRELIALLYSIDTIQFLLQKIPDTGENHKIKEMLTTKESIRNGADTRKVLNRAVMIDIHNGSISASNNYLRRANIYLMGGENLSQINKIDLSNNYLGVDDLYQNTIAEWVFECSNLQELNLSNNYIRVLPDEIGNLTSLQTLDLGQNYIRHLPTSIGKLKSLKKLILPTYVEQQEIQKIQKLLPHCTIHQEGKNSWLDSRNHHKGYHGNNGFYHW